MLRCIVRGSLGVRPVPPIESTQASPFWSEPCQGRAGERKAKDREGALPGDPAERGERRRGRRQTIEFERLLRLEHDRRDAAALERRRRGPDVERELDCESVARDLGARRDHARDIRAPRRRASAFLLVASGSTRGGATGASAGPSASG